jgi:hypothetical protein
MELLLCCFIFPLFFRFFLCQPQIIIPTAFLAPASVQLNEAGEKQTSTLGVLALSSWLLFCELFVLQHNTLHISDFFALHSPRCC